MEDEAIGVKEVMRILKYSESQVYKMVASGALKTIKAVPGIRFSKHYIMSILNTGGASYNPECAMLKRQLEQEQEKNKKLQALLVEIANRSLEGVKKEVLE